MELLDFISGVAVNHEVLVYGLMAILAAVAGPIVSIAGGILFRWEYFDFLPLYLVLMIGELIGDIVWYYLGSHSSRFVSGRFGKYFGITPESIARIEGIFHNHKDAILIVSKLTTGFGFATLVLFTAGMVKIPFRRYFAINVIGQFVWSAALIFLGYFFAHLYEVFDSIFARSTLIAAGVVVIFLMGRYAQYMRRRVLKS